MKEKMQSHLIPIMSIVVIAISLGFSIKFFAEINIFFAVLVVIVEMTKAVYINYIGKSQHRAINVLMVIVVCFAVVFSITGVVANGYNFVAKNNANQYKSVDNPKYTEYTKQLKIKTEMLEAYEKELSNYPSFGEYTKGSPAWEDKTNLNKDYMSGKNAINEKISQANKEIDGLKVPEKTLKQQVGFTGYGDAFNQISNLTGIKVNTLFMILTFMFAVLIELIIFSLFLMNKNVAKTCDKVDQKKEPIATSITTSEPITTSITTPEIITPVAKITTCDNQIATVVIERDKDIATVATPVKPTFESVATKKVISITTKKDNQIKEITTYITTKYKSGDVINSKDIKARYNLTDRNWSDVKKHLGDKVITKGTKTYYMCVANKKAKKN